MPLKVGIVGMGYVGIPLMLSFTKNEYFQVIGFDIDAARVSMLNSGVSCIRHIPDADIAEQISLDKFRATTYFGDIIECHAVFICVPTPLNKNREPEMRHIVSAARSISPFLRKGMLVVLESTTYPGTTDELLVRELATSSSLVAGRDFYLAFSPEREDPGNKRHSTKTTPKVVGGLTPACTVEACRYYGLVMDMVVPVSGTRVAEMSKLLENIFRSVNIALVNEMKKLCDAMHIDIWEVIAAASTKPFGFMPFYPGPGLGGHCIPVDPFYLTWKAREYELPTRFIELAGEINMTMPHYVVDKVAAALNLRKKAMYGSTVLVMGVAYKKDVDDVREAPALRIIQLLLEHGCNVFYYDEYVRNLPGMRDHDDEEMCSVYLDNDILRAADAVLIVTDHSNVDYQNVAMNAKLVVDTRNACRDVAKRDHIVKA
jgi:UDP-N-acetyl-D-glucosamine dehydrogenase